jgi:hypothetical protein
MIGVKKFSGFKFPGDFVGRIPTPPLPRRRSQPMHMSGSRIVQCKLIIEPRFADRKSLL